jgi:nicotinamide-nucleotide amidase
MTTTELIRTLSSSIIEVATKSGVMVAAAESCTGGMITAALTDVPGSSAVVDRGFVTYTNEAKHEMLGVPMELIDAHGAVSEEVAGAMAAGALHHSHADIAVSVTGIAGPTGGSASKPVGLVWFGLARRNGGVHTVEHIFVANSRGFVRTEAAQKALQLILSALD